MLILDPVPGAIHRYRAAALEPEIVTSSVDPFSSSEKLEVFGYVLQNGASSIMKKVEEITPSVLERLAQVQNIAPDENKTTVELVREGLIRFPGGRHSVLCESAFFTEMPARARFYALPQPQREGHPRSGMHGLTHAWTWKNSGRPAKLVSIILGDRPACAAIANGAGVETGASAGALEGLPSLKSCGGFDPTIVLELLRGGQSVKEVRDLLNRKSGFQVFSENPISLAAVVHHSQLARQILLDGLIRESGEALTALEGAQVVTISAEAPDEWQDIIAELKRRMAFAKVDVGVMAAPRGRVLAETLEASLSYPT